MVLASLMKEEVAWLVMAKGEVAFGMMVLLMLVVSVAEELA